ncbi:DUF4924 family protein [Reichenbachiella versicolor]|uniref:DUF4924 family protein n=1 Tax=Reichenbachiella versicolor TaxID=1821036 RepID=UPI0013A5768F|nr:DUF4924 family protein [Reichenbachiella versicolor]
MDAKQNISEYIIEMYRKEDLMRAYKFDLEKFGTQVINFFPVDPKEKLAAVNYYEELMQKMQKQGIEISGHLDEVNELVDNLEALHISLKESDEAYLNVYQKASEYIQNNLKEAKGIIKGEVQVCLNGVYGFLLLKIEERPIKPDEQSMVDAFGDLLSLLSYKYQEKVESN